MNELKFRLMILKSLRVLWWLVLVGLLFLAVLAIAFLVGLNETIYSGGTIRPTLPAPGTPTVTPFTVYLPLIARGYPSVSLVLSEGFESPLSAYTHRCVALHGGEAQPLEIENIFVPPAWTFWFVHQPDTWDQPEGRPVAFPERVHSGEWGYSWFTFYRKHDAGLFQQVTVLPGAHVRLTGWAHAWSSTRDDGQWSEGPGYDCGFKLEGDPTANSDWRNFTFRLGIDPTGGANPLASTVVWGQGAHIYNCYAEVPTVEATAASGKITVFLRSTTLWPFKHNDAYWDDVSVEVVR